MIQLCNALNKAGPLLSRGVDPELPGFVPVQVHDFPGVDFVQEHLVPCALYDQDIPPHKRLLALR